jgi:hypothetical protein
MYSESKVGTPQPTRKNSVSGGFFWMSGKCSVFDCEMRLALMPICPSMPTAAWHIPSSLT